MFAQVRDQLLSVWKHQSPVQRVILIALVISAAILIPILITWASTPTYSVAFSGLSEEDAGQIVQKLTDEGTPYQLRDSSTILVPSSQVYEVRLRMAKEGLPQGSNVGFELFSTNTFGMTEFTQKVNYQRALEGELERTIGSMAAISAVRVHVVTPEKALLSEDQAPTTASITVQEKPGMHLDLAQVRAITHLVASSVENLQPENVVVIDVNGNMLASGQKNSEAAAAAENDNHRAAEIAAAKDLQQKVEALLETALGPNRSVVQASVSMDWTQRETQIEAFDPARSSIRSSQTVSEVYTTTGGTIGGVPGAATNLPPVSNTEASTNQGSNYYRNERTTNYEITQSTTKEIASPGTIDRISLSVLVDGITDTVQLNKLQTVIAAAAGINQERGDLLAVQTLAFDRTYYQQQAAEMNASQQMELYIRIGEIVIGILLVVGLLWYVQRLLNNLRLASAQAWTPILKPVSEIALPGGIPGAGVAQPGMMPIPSMGAGPLPLQETLAQVMPSLVMPGEVHLEEGAPGLPRFTLPQAKPEIVSEEEEQLKQMIITMAEENPATVAEIIQMWLSEDEK